MASDSLQSIKEQLIEQLNNRVQDGIIEQANAELIIKLINQSEDVKEATNIAALGTTYKKTGFHFDKRLEKNTGTIKFFKKNEELSFNGGGIMVLLTN